MISAASASSLVSVSLNDPPRSFFDLPRGRSALGGLPGFGRLVLGAGTPQRPPGGPYAAFGPAPAARRMASPVHPSHHGVYGRHGRDHVSDHAALGHRRERLQVGKRGIPEMRAERPRAAVADRMAA